MALDGQSDKMASDTEMCMKKKHVTEILYREKNHIQLTFTDTCWTVMEAEQRKWAQWGSG